MYVASARVVGALSRSALRRTSSDWVGPSPSTRHRPLRVVPAELDQRCDHLLPGGGEPRRAEAGEVERRATPGRGLALRGGKQDQHAGHPRLFERSGQGRCGWLLAWCRRAIAAYRELREGVTAIQHELHVTPEFPDEVQTAAEQDAGEPRMPELDLTAAGVRDHRPRGGHGPRPGDAPRVRRRRLRGALRDRRRDGLRDSRGPRRPGGARARRVDVRRRQQGAPPPEGPQRGRSVAAAGRGPSRVRVDDRSRCRR